MSWTRRHLITTAGLAAVGCSALGLGAGSAAPRHGFGARRFPLGSATEVRLVGVPAEVLGESAAFDAGMDAALEGAAGQALAARIRGDLAAGRPVRALVKPAVNSPRAYPYTASPRSVRAVCAWLAGLGVDDITVADMAGPSRDTADALRATGLRVAALEGGAHRVRTFEGGPWETHVVPRATGHGGSFALTSQLSDATVLINVARASTHKLAGLSLSLKNWQGLAGWSTRMRSHRGGNRRLADRMAEYALAVKPDLVVVDAGQVTTTHGPDKGLVVPVGSLVVAQDMVAADLVSLGLLRWASLSRDGRPRKGRPDCVADPTAPLWQAPVIGRAVALNVGVTAPDQLRLSPIGVPPELIGWLERDLARVA